MGQSGHEGLLRTHRIAAAITRGQFDHRGGGKRIGGGQRPGNRGHAIGMAAGQLILASAGSCRPLRRSR